MPAFLELADHVEHLADQFGVECRRDLVEQHHLGTESERPGDRDALLLTAGQLVGVGAARSDRPSRARSSDAICLASERERPSTLRGPIATLSSTDMCRKRLKLWNTMPMRRRTGRGRVPAR
jgi:hypothetical protein